MKLMLIMNEVALPRTDKWNRKFNKWFQQNSFMGILKLTFIHKISKVKGCSHNLAPQAPTMFHTLSLQCKCKKCEISFKSGIIDNNWLNKHFNFNLGLLC
jgi:hypothetical protein